MLRQPTQTTIQRKPAKPISTVQLEFEHVRRDTGEPSGSLSRGIAVLARLPRTKSVDYDWYYRYFELSERQFGRDLQHLRKICSELGITISKSRVNGRAMQTPTLPRGASLDGRSDP